MLKFVNRSLDNRITFSVACIIIGMVLAIGFFVYQFTYEKVATQLTEMTTQQAKSISKEVEDLFENASIVTEQLTYHKDIKTYLKEVQSRDDIKSHLLYKDVRMALVDIKENSAYYSTIWIANEQANFYFDDIGNFSDETYDVSLRPWYEPAINSHDVAFTKPYVEWSTGDTVLSAIKALRDSIEVYGFVAVDVTLDSIPEVFRAHYLGYNEQFFLVSNDGQYVYHPDETKIMAASILDEGDMLYPYKDTIFQGNRSFNEVLINNKKSLLLSFPVELANWRVVTLIQEDVLFAQVRNLFITMFIMLLVTLLVTIVVIRAVVRKQVSPFAVLVEFANDITRGALDKNIPEEYINREDEMGKLSNSFQLIIDAFRNENINLEEKIDEKNRELKQQYDYILETEKVASLGGLVAGIAHEINTPLGNSVTSLSYLCKINEATKSKLMDGKLSREELVVFFEEVDKSILLIDGNLNRSVGLIDNFKKISVNQEGDSKESVNLKGIISMVTVSLKHEIKQGLHHVQNNCLDSLEIVGYPSAMIQIFTNLMMNSIQHGFKGIQEGIIDIEAFIKADQLTIIYKDNGIGMSKKSVKNVYEPFYTTARGDGKAGLGMAIVFNLINQKLGGTINVTSNMNKGTTVLIQLPLEIKKSEEQ